MFTQSQIDNLTIEEKIRYGFFPIDTDTEERLHAGELAINSLNNVGIWPVYSNAETIESELSEVISLSAIDERERLKLILDFIADRIKGIQKIHTDAKQVSAKLEDLQKDVANWKDNLEY